MTNGVVHTISCGGQPRWWPELIAHTEALIAGESSLLLLPPKSNRATATAIDNLQSVDGAALPGPTLFVFTSGSTGEPKLVALSIENLKASNDAVNQRLGFRPRWATALPPEHIGGYLTVFRSLANGFTPTLLLKDDATFDEKVFNDKILDEVSRANGYDEPIAISLVWRQMSKLAATNRFASLKSFQAVLVGGGPPNSTAAQVAKGEGVPVTTTYGMTETCGGVVFDGLALSGISIGIEANSGDVGPISISGPTVARGYWGLEGLSEFKDSTFRSQDLGTLDDQGRLTVIGRIDDIAIVNGYKVSLTVVSNALRELPNIDDAVAIVERNDQGDDALVAYVATNSDSPPDLAEIRAYLARALGRGALPARLEVLAELPRTRNHKLDKSALN